MGKKLYVGNLPFSATEELLVSTFSQCGNVDSARLIIDRETGKSKGFAFVEMSSDEEAREAISQLDGQDFGGRNMKVNEAKPMESNGGSRGGFGGGGNNRGGFGGGRNRY